MRSVTSRRAVALFVTMLPVAGCGARSLLADDEGSTGTRDDGGADAALRDHDAATMDAFCGACALGQTECEDGGIASCIADKNGCGAWGAPIACGTSGVCAGDPGSVSCRVLDIEAPRPIAPLSTSTVTSHRPRFRWELAGQDDGARVEICSDRACSNVVTSFTAVGTSGTPDVSLAAGLYYWRVSGREGGFSKDVFGPVWELTVPVRNSDVNTSWGTALDGNGDGFAEVAVGARIVDQYADSPGAAFVYMGSAAGVSTTPVVLSNPNQFLGAEVASGGDINGDGYADLLVGVPDANNSGGVVLVYLGSAAGFATAATEITAPDGKFEFGAWVTSAGDINRDGYADVLISAPYAKAAHYLYYGGPSGLSRSPVVLSGGVGFGLTTASDINGDGFADVLVASGSGAGNTTSGEVDVYYGTATGLGSTPTVMSFSGSAAGYFGLYVTDSGDVNGDGFGDIALGLYGTGTGPDGGVGTVEIFLGSAGGLTAGPSFLNPGPQYSLWGDRLSGAWDVNGDGFDDLVMGDPGYAARPAQIAFGGPSGPTALTPIGVPPDDTGGFGDPVAGGGDVNGDGFMDVLIGAVGSPGAAYVFYGSSTGLVATPVSLDGPPHAYSYGVSLAE